MLLKPFRGSLLNKTHPLAKGLVGCWLMNEGSGNKVFDLTKNNINSALNNFASPYGWIVDELGYALDFDGSDDHITVKTNQLIASYINSSVVIWIKTTQADSSGAHAIYSERGSAGNALWTFNCADQTNAQDSLQFVHRDDAGTLSFVFKPSSQTVITDGIWHQVAITKAGTTITIYIDGLLEYAGSITGNNTLTEASMETWVCGDKGDATSDLACQMNQILIYGCTLTVEAIARLYREPYAMFQQNRARWFSIPAVSEVDAVPLLMHQAMQRRAS